MLPVSMQLPCCAQATAGSLQQSTDGCRHQETDPSAPSACPNGTGHLQPVCRHASVKLAGTREQAINALQRKSYQKLTRVVDVLIDSGKVPELVTHYFGNYSIQDLMEACFKLRKVARVMDFQASWECLRWLSKHLSSGVRQLCMFPRASLV